MKVLAYTIAAAGHQNAVIGLCQALLARNHEIYFTIEPGFAGNLAKYGFNEILLPKKILPKSSSNKEDEELYSGNPVKYLAKRLKEMGMLSGLNARQKVDLMLNNNQQLDEKVDAMILDDPVVKSIVEEVKPDLILLDEMFILPSILHGETPWVLICSMQPTMLYASKNLPPPWSGFPTNDQTQWAEFDAVFSQWRLKIQELQNKILSHFNYPPVELQSYLPESPYLTIYGYPKELDYQDIVPKVPGRKVLQIDAFNRRNPEPYRFPEEFQNKLKPGDKLIYISMGSMGSIDVDLMKRILASLASTPHKYIVSKGPLGDEYELPDNAWGEGYLPQVSILPLVDAVITHGGNNTTTETICAGKPMIVMPLFADQFDNAQRVHEKEFGIRIEPYHFESEDLVKAVERLLTDEAMKRRVEETAKRIANANSKGKACVALEELVAKHHKSYTVNPQTHEI